MHATASDMAQYNFGAGGAPDDLVLLEQVIPKSMLACLLQRYMIDEIYTWVGAAHSVLVSINPFKQLPIYTIENMHSYRQQTVEEASPHTFAIAKRAFQSASLDRHNQAILISGESGAGKTECTKQCLAYLSEIAGGQDNLEQSILNANPVLEAFGNAKTVNNNNSSRFGKWMSVGFAWDGRICSASIEPFMLESSRVPSQAPLERSYHIFYQLLSATPADFEGAQSLGLHSGFTSDFLQGEVRTVDGMDDSEDFRDTCSAFLNLGFSVEDRAWVFRVAAAILHLGNVKFIPSGEACTIDPESADELEKTADLLQVSSGQLSVALCERHLKVGNEETVMYLTPQQALETRDTMAKQVYSRLFHWLVKQINASIAGAGSGSVNIGILDIFGFEIFTKNSFEQLCINFCNEKLQQQFNKHTFKEEIDLYKAEGVPFENVPFIDNQPVLDLLEKKPMGVLLLLDEEVRAPKGDDARWLSKCDQNNKDHKAWKRKIQRGGQGIGGVSGDDLVFTVTHYAGDVQYTGNGFVEKNRDAPLRCVSELMQNTSAPRSKELFPKEKDAPQKTATSGETFRRQLTDLIGVLQVCEQNYIRCVKPNQAKKPQQFESYIVNEQLTYSGVYEAVKIRKAGYPYRMDICKFWAKFRCLRCCKKPMIKFSNEKDPFTSLKELFKALSDQDFSGLCYGRTKVFYHVKEHQALTKLRSQCLGEMVPVAQRAIRRFIGRCFLRDLRLANEHLRKGLQSDDVPTCEKEYEASVDLVSQHAAFDYIPYLRTKLQDHIDKLNQAREKEIVQELMVKAMEAGDMEEHAKLLRRLRELDLAPLVKEALDTLDEALLEQVVDQGSQYSDINVEGLNECKRLLELSELDLITLQLQMAKERGDERRIQNAQFRLKLMHIEANLEALSFTRHASLRGGKEWSAIKNVVGKSMYVSNRKKLAESYLVHSKTPIHASLTTMPRGEKNTRRSIASFKSIMAYMGDCTLPYPDTQVAEVVNTARGKLNTEIYLQVMKQLTSNPTEASQKRGWDVLMLLINNAPPENTDDQDIVAAFVIKNAPSAGVEKRLISMLLGPQRPAVRLEAEFIPESISKISERRISRRFTKRDIGAAVVTIDGVQMEKPTKPMKALNSQVSQFPDME